MNSFERTEHPSVQEVLKQRLFVGELGPQDFLDELFRLDQATHTRDAAVQNLPVLKDESVRSYFQSQELHRPYWNLLSVTYVHIAQIMASRKENRRALEYFADALGAARHITDADYAWWQNYCEGTIAYFRQDISSLQKAIERAQDESVSAILENLLKGLNDTGEVDYERDMARQRTYEQ